MIDLICFGLGPLYPIALVILAMFLIETITFIADNLKRLGAGSARTTQGEK